MIGQRHYLAVLYILLGYDCMVKKERNLKGKQVEIGYASIT